MAYEKQTWTTGEVITEEKLNHIEDGLAEAGQTSYFDINMNDGEWTITDLSTRQEVSRSDIATMITEGKVLSFTEFGARKSLTVQTAWESGGNNIVVSFVNSVNNNGIVFDIFTLPVSGEGGNLVNKSINFS